MNRQEIYNKIKTHLLKQGRRSQLVVNGFPSRCLYRGPEGLSCALGPFIPDEMYETEFESYAPTCPTNKAYRQMPLVKRLSNAISSTTGAKTERDFDFLGELQGIHDGVEPKKWADRLVSFATANDLTP